MAMKKNEDACFLAAVEKIRTGRTYVITGWALQAEGFKTIIENKYYKTHAGYTDVKEFIANYEPVQDDPDHVLEMVSVFKEFGESPIKKLPYRRARTLFHLPEDAKKSLKKNSEKVEELAKQSDAKFKKTVAAMKASVPKNLKGDGPNKMGLYEKITHRRRGEAKSITSATRSQIETEGWEKDIKAKADTIMVDMGFLIKLAESIGETSFTYAIAEDPLVRKIQDFLAIVLTDMQHGEIGTDSIALMMNHIEKKIKRDKDNMDVAQYLRKFVPIMEKCREAVKRFDALSVKAEIVKPATVSYIHKKEAVNQ